MSDGVTALDAVGRPVVVTAGDGSVTSTAYTVDGYVDSVMYPDRTVSSTYDGVGNRVSMTDLLGMSVWVYDWAGRVTSETDARGNTQAHTFDGAGNEVGTVYSDGRTVVREFDARALVVSQTDLTGTSDYVYDGNGRVVEASLPSGVTSTYERDAVGQVTGIHHVGVSDDDEPWFSPCLPGNSHRGWDKGFNHWWKQPAQPQFVSIDYAYDVRGLVTVKDMSVNGDHDVVAYVHDALGRLVTSASVEDTVRYGWDAASNLVLESHSDDVSTQRPRDGFAVSREVDGANQLVREVSTALTGHHFAPVTTSYGYDARGNRTSETVTVGMGWRANVVGRVSYTYDGRDDLVSVVDAGGNLKSWRDDEVTRFVRDGVGRAL